jgi:hypothetical protein
MTFPATDLPIRLRISPLADPNLAPGTWRKWEEITEDVRLGTSDRVEISEGRGSYDSDVDTSTMNLTLDNRAHDDGRVAGRYLAGNPLSPYALSRNTPIMASLGVAEDGFGRTESNGWGAVETPHFPGISWTPLTSAADFSVSSGAAQTVLTSANQLNAMILTGGDMFQSYGRATYTTSAVSTGGDVSAAIRLRYQSSSNYYYLRLNFKPAGALSVSIARMRNGVFSTVASTDLASTYTAGQAVTFAWQVVGASLSVKAWLASDSEPNFWDATLQDTEVIEGSTFRVEFWRTSGVTNPGTITMTMDDFSVESVEFAGYVRNWPARWDKRGLNAFVPIYCTGILGRVRQQDRGTKIVQSPLYRQLSSYQSALYLPLEDEDGAVRPANVAQGGVGGYFDDMTVGQSSNLPGATRVVSFASDTSRLRGYPRLDLSKGTGFSCMFLMKFPSLPGSAVDMAIIATNTAATADRWVLRFDGASLNVRAFRDSDLSVIVPASPVLYGLDPTRWIAVELRLEVVGANTNWTVRWTEVGTDGYYTNSGSYASSVVPYVTSFALNSASAVTGTQFSHLWIGQNTLPFFSQTFVNVWAGYPREVSGVRYKRILSEAGISGYVEPGSTEEMGPQETASSLTILKSCQDAEHGIMYESGWGLALRPRVNRYQRPVTLTLDKDSGQISDQPEGEYDDRWLVNDATGGRPGGAQGVHWSDEDHVAREGRYPKPFTWNVATDDRIKDHLAWEVFVGTRPGYFWPMLSLDFARNPDLAAGWRGRAFGARLQVTNKPEQLSGQDIDLIVEGTRTTWGKNTWKVAANCSNALAWEIPVTDDDELRIDADETLLDATIDESDLTFSATVTVGKPWNTDAAEFPFSAMIFASGDRRGEEVTVDSISGTGTTQTWTLSARAVNGVSMSHLSGARIGLARPTHLAL